MVYSINDILDILSRNLFRYEGMSSGPASTASMQAAFYRNSMDQGLMSRVYLEAKYSRYIKGIKKDGNKWIIICNRTMGENNSRLHYKAQKKIDELIMSFPFMIDVEIVDIYGHKVYGYDKS